MVVTVCIVYVCQGVSLTWSSSALEGIEAVARIAVTGTYFLFRV